MIKPSDLILNKLKEFKVTSVVKMASSYKFCVIATGEYDIYAAKERANEWDYAAGHAVAQNAGAIIKTLEEKIEMEREENEKIQGEISTSFMEKLLHYDEMINNYKERLGEE